MKNKYLKETERIKIEALRKAKVPVKEIAEQLGKSRSTIYREIKLGTVTQIETHMYKDVQVYLSDAGQRIQTERGRKKGCKKKFLDSSLLSKISELLHKKYSPYAVAQRLKEEGIKISEKTIYNYIHKGLIPEFKESNMLYYRKKKKKKESEKRIARNHSEHRSIEERPKEIYQRQDFGHWELDSVESGKGDKTTLLCFTERKYRLELIYKVSGKTAENTAKILNALERKLTAPLFREIFKTITMDNGCEFTDQTAIEKSIYNKKLTRTTVYYCHPFCSSERGSNENQNKFIRRYIPKGDFISLYSDSEIKGYQSTINNYPRKLFDNLSAIQKASQDGIFHTYGKLLGLLS